MNGLRRGEPTDAPPPVTVFTFLLTLPYALPVPEGSTPGFVDRRTSIWDEWSPAWTGKLVGGPDAEPLSDEVVPGTRIAIRHREVTMPVPPAAAFEAFTDWIEPPLSPDVFARLTEDTRKWKSTGVSTVISVVALSRYVPRSAHPRGEEMTIGWLLEILRPALADLDNFLEALGIVARRWDIGALPPRSLPFMVPLLVESTHPGPAGEKQGTTAMVPLHDLSPMLPERFETSEVLFAGAKGISNAANQGDQPFMLVLRLIHAAEAERLGGDPTKALIDLNTAIEVLVSTTISVAGRVVGWDEERIARAVSWRTGLKKRVTDHLGPLFGEELAIEDEDEPWGRWFVGGYRLRNAAVHEGRVLRKADVDDALLEAEAVVRDVQERLSRKAELIHLAERLEVEFGPSPAWESEPLVISFPWE
jgi:hypothetical protein